MDEIGRALGADQPGQSAPVVLFVPSLDRDGLPIDQTSWVEAALAVLGKLFGGATALPTGRGAWWNPDAERMLHESVVVVFSLASRDDATDTNLIRELGVFLRCLGRDGRQGEVGVLINNNYYGITNYEEDEEASDV